MLPIAYITTCIVSFLEIPLIVFSQVISITIGVRKTWQSHRMGRLDFAVKTQESDK